MRAIHGVLLVAAVLIASGCEFPDLGERVASEEMTEKAVVDDAIFAPSQHGSGSGFGLSMKGTMVITSQSVDIPETYAVVFRCQHGKFVIQGEGERYKALWQKLHRGQEVTVRFREIYIAYKDGRRIFKKYDFIDAN